MAGELSVCGCSSSSCQAIKGDKSRVDGVIDGHTALATESIAALILDTAVYTLENTISWSEPHSQSF